MLKLTC